MSSQRKHNTQKRLEVSFLNRVNTELYQTLVLEYDREFVCASLHQSGDVRDVWEKKHVADCRVFHVENALWNTE